MPEHHIRLTHGDDRSADGLFARMKLSEEMAFVMSRPSFFFVKYKRAEISSQQLG